MSFSKCGGQFAGCLADDLDVVNHPGVDEFILLEDAPTSLGIPLNVLDRIQDVL